VQEYFNSPSAVTQPLQEDNSSPFVLPQKYTVYPSGTWACHTCHISSNNKKKKYSITLKIHEKSVEIKINTGKIVTGKSCFRGKVKGLSYKSVRKMRLLLEDTADLWQITVTLTYPGEFPLNGRKVKRDIDAMNHWFKRQGVTDIFWTIEFQERGAPHVHCLLSSKVDKKKLSAAWYKIVGSGDLKHLEAGTSTGEIKDRDRLTTYVLGYHWKKDQKEVPENFQNVGRFWGCTRRAKERATYTYRYDDFQSLSEALKPAVEYYQAKMEEWSQGKEKPYTWTFRGNSFICWSGTEKINQMIEEGKFQNDVLTEFESSST
jgi:hypothetical protein